MNDTPLIRDLFVSDVTRDIPPVVYFHEQTPEKLAAEVSEYIITGGWPENHPNHDRVPNGIHEQYVRLLTNIVAELSKKGGADLPNAWISGFYGSGKSSFAKLFGLALDGVPLPDGTSLTEAWLRRDTSPRATELSQAWDRLRKKIDPLAVVFDIGAIARDSEHIHAAAIRQLQRRLGYCSTEPLVADFELRLERDGEWARFEKVAAKVLPTPWADVKDRQLAEEDFSLVMSEMYPDRYPDPMRWFESHGGTSTRVQSPEEAVAAIRDMLKFRRPNATLFLVIDEVSQYILSSKDRVDRLRAFAMALGRLKGKAWLLALGQQKLDEAADETFRWAQDRFPPKLRIHLANTNIRDVVHKRLLQKKPEVEARLQALFERNRANLKLYAYDCQDVRPQEFCDFYPMLPGQIDLILQITSALRNRSARAQGDDQTIRGLLQLLGELFRQRMLADRPLGDLVTFDEIYEVQHTALDSDVQASMARILNHCAGDSDKVMVRAAKAVALLELIQDTLPTDAKLVAQCLYRRVDLGNQVAEVQNALDTLRRKNLLGYSEKTGYKIQSSVAEEWERERRDLPVPIEARSEIIQNALAYLIADPERPRLDGRPFPWAAVFSDGRRADDVSLRDPREDAAVRIDFRFLPQQERTESAWIKRSAETALKNRLVWVAGDTDQAETLAHELGRSQAMVRKYKPRRESLSGPRKTLLQEEENRIDELKSRVTDAVAEAWMAGSMYFRGRSIAPRDHGGAFKVAVHAAATRILPDLYPHFDSTIVEPSELLQLIELELSGPSPKFLTGQLGILELSQERYASACTGAIPRRIEEHIKSERGLSGTTLLAHFGKPPYGYTANVIKACVAGLLRKGAIRIQPEAGPEITAVRDPGVREVFEKDRAFRRASLVPGGGGIPLQGKARICKFFEQYLHQQLDREDHVIADAVAQQFPPLSQTLRRVQAKLNRLPGSPEGPAVFPKLGEVIERCIKKCRETKPTVELVYNHLDTLNEGVHLLQSYDVELTNETIAAVNEAHAVLSYQAKQLEEVEVLATNVDAAAARLSSELSSGTPWRTITTCRDDIDEIHRAYVAERKRLLTWQEAEVENAREGIKGRTGFSTLTADDAHRVLKPLAKAVTETDEDAIAPSLSDLGDPFRLRLERAEDKANEILDNILSGGDKPMVVRVDLGLRGRELSTEADVEALISEIKARLLETIGAGTRVRLVVEKPR